MARRPVNPLTIFSTPTVKRSSQLPVNRTYGSAPPIRNPFPTMGDPMLKPTQQLYNIQQQQALLGQGPLGQQGINRAAVRGAMGTLLDEVIVTIELRTAVLAQFNSTILIKTNRLTETDLLRVITTWLYTPLRDGMNTLARVKVPQDTERLLNAVMGSYGGSRTGGASSYSQVYGLHPFQVVLNTGNVEYANVANNMPTLPSGTPGAGHLRHPPQAYKSYRTGRSVKHSHTLNDPGAETHWFETLTDFGQTTAHNLWFGSTHMALEQLVQSVMPPLTTNVLPGRPINLTASQIVDGLFEVTFG